MYPDVFSSLAAADLSIPKGNGSFEPSHIHYENEQRMKTLLLSEQFSIALFLGHVGFHLIPAEWQTRYEKLLRKDVQTPEYERKGHDLLTLTTRLSAMCVFAKHDSRFEHSSRSTVCVHNLCLQACVKQRSSKFRAISSRSSHSRSRAKPSFNPLSQNTR